MRFISILPYFLFFLLTIGHSPVFAQQVSENQVRAELERRGIDEDLLKEKLLKRGIEIDDLSNIPPERLPEIQQILSEVIAEIESETVSSIQTISEEQAQENAEQALDEQANQLSGEAAENISESIQEGASVQEAVSEELIDRKESPPTSIYGHHLFRNQTLQIFRQAETIKARPDYILGSGDEITISIWGVSNYENTFSIDQSGYIRPDRMPRILLKGLRFDDARQKLLRTFRNFYRFSNDEFEISLRFARTLSIGIFGEVFHPGNYTISAIHTAFNALAAADGPTDIGSVRNIKWINGNGDSQILDIYEYMRDPSIAQQFYLSEGDIIHVPIAKKIVEIKGAVNREFKYELKEEENLNALISYAGGLKSNAFRKTVQVKRFGTDQEVLIDIPYAILANSGADFDLQDGDVITVRTIPSIIRNVVTINGAVDFPGRYELKGGAKFSELLELAQTNETTYPEIAFIRRANFDNTFNFIRVDLNEVVNNHQSQENIILQNGDEVSIYAKSRFADQYTVTVSGAVRDPGNLTFDQSKTLRISDLVLLSGGVTDNSSSFGYLIREDLATGEKQYIRINIASILANESANDNLVVEPQDYLLIQSQNSFIDIATVEITGAVRSPGVFQYAPSLQLSDLITLAEGLDLGAAKNRIEVSRVLITDNEPTTTVVASLEIDEDYNITNGADFQLQPYDIVNVRHVPDFQLQESITINGEVLYPGRYSLISDNEKITSVLHRAGGLNGEAFPAGATLQRIGDGPIVIQLDEVLRNENSVSNIIMKDGDILNIPKVKDIVTLKGAVNAIQLYDSKLLNDENGINVVYDGRRSARYYINEFTAGFSENADPKKVTVEYPNGEVKKSKNYLLFHTYPRVVQGSIVNVGIKAPEPESAEGKDVDWGGVVTDAITQATAVLTLILLIDRASR